MGIEKGIFRLTGNNRSGNPTDNPLKADLPETKHLFVDLPILFALSGLCFLRTGHIPFQNQPFLFCALLRTIRCFVFHCDDADNYHTASFPFPEILGLSVVSL